jgi:catechol 2,3-dioxygenase-like lactoylglutathione lyase family enzyme
MVRAHARRRGDPQHAAGEAALGLTVDGIDALVAELKAKGVEFSRGPTTVRPGVRVAFLRAPEGVSIELLERKPV